MAQPMITPQKSYLPSELLQKDVLHLCFRCHKHVSSQKTASPPKAYWNHLQPGTIPPELLNLSEAERGLLCRIVPFVKVVKLSGHFGQYGFKGQAVLFAKDIFEVTQQLPKMLPRSSTDTSLVVVTENLENINVAKQFTISRDAIYKALNWLIHNNPLYQDVVIDQNINLNSDNILRNATAIPEDEGIGEDSSENNSCQYNPIGDNSRILRASWHQADQVSITGNNV